MLKCNIITPKTTLTTTVNDLQNNNIFLLESVICNHNDSTKN